MKKLLHIAVLCGMLVFSMQLAAQVQPAVSPDFEPIHWAYSSFFGTGWYQVKDARSVFVLRVPPRQTLRKSFISDAGERQVGMEIRYPLTVGLHDLEDLGDLIEDDNFGTVSFVPGVEFEIPVTSRWYLRPFVNFGWGTELESGESAWIYYAGIKSRYTFPAGKHEWSLLNSLYYAGYSPDEGRSDHLATADLGVEFRQALSAFTLNSRPVDLHWSLMYSFMGNELHFNLAHSGGLALYAFCLEDAVGVDVEEERELSDALQISERFFSPAERETLKSLPEERRIPAFFRCWSRKEAFFKAVGEGLSYPLDAFDVTLALDDPPRLLAIRGSAEEARAWSLYSIALPSGYHGALAVRSKAKHLQQWRLH